MSKRMRPISARVLATHTAAEIDDPACKWWGLVWSHLETAHRQSTTPEEAAAAAAPAMNLCRQCDQATSCHLWATLDNYTGLAAGGAYRNGRRLDSVDVIVYEGTPPARAEAS